MLAECVITGSEQLTWPARPAPSVRTPWLVSATSRVSRLGSRIPYALRLAARTSTIAEVGQRLWASCPGSACRVCPLSGRLREDADNLTDMIVDRQEPALNWRKSAAQQRREATDGATGRGRELRGLLAAMPSSAMDCAEGALASHAAPSGCDAELSSAMEAEPAGSDTAPADDEGQADVQRSRCQMMSPSQINKHRY